MPCTAESRRLLSRHFGPADMVIARQRSRDLPPACAPDPLRRKPLQKLLSRRTPVLDPLIADRDSQFPRGHRLSGAFVRSENCMIKQPRRSKSGGVAAMRMGLSGQASGYSKKLSIYGFQRAAVAVSDGSGRRETESHLAGVEGLAPAAAYSGSRQAERPEARLCEFPGQSPKLEKGFICLVNCSLECSQ